MTEDDRIPLAPAPGAVAEVDSTAHSWGGGGPAESITAGSSAGQAADAIECPPAIAGHQDDSLPPSTAGTAVAGYAVEPGAINATAAVGEMTDDCAAEDSLLDEEGADSKKVLESTQVLKKRRGGAVRRFPIAVWPIFGSEVSERFSYYGMRAILSLYFNKALGFSPETSTAFFHAFVCLCYLTPVAGGYIADARWGKYKVILRLCLVYVIGAFIIAGTAVHPNAVGAFVGLTLVGLGTGGIKPCVSTFGGDQFPPGSDKDISIYFHIFYFSINVGSFASIVITPLLKQFFTYWVAFLLPAVLLAFSTFIFRLGKRKYIRKPPAGSPITIVMRVHHHAFWGRLRRGCTRQKGVRFLDNAVRKCGAQTVNDVRSLGPVVRFFATMPAFWALYDQQGSRWLFQADMMDRRVGPFVLEPENLMALNALCILVLIPIFEKLVYPVISKIGFNFTPPRRVAAGMFIAAFAFFVAGCLQMIIDVRPVHVFWQIPQIVIITVAEILCSITCLEYAYSQAPESMKGVVMAMFLLTTAFGNLVVALTSHLSFGSGSAAGSGSAPFDYFFFAALMIVCLIVFPFMNYRGKSRRKAAAAAEDSSTLQSLELQEMGSSADGLSGSFFRLHEIDGAADAGDGEQGTGPRFASTPFFAVESGEDDDTQRVLSEFDEVALDDDSQGGVPPEFEEVDLDDPPPHFTDYGYPFTGTAPPAYTLDPPSPEAEGSRRAWVDDDV